MLQSAIVKLVNAQDLTPAEAEAAMNTIMTGDATPAQIGAFLVALRVKGETVDEIIGCARALRTHVRAVRPRRTDVVDTCGTGGDGAGTFNISTTVAFVVAGTGLAVAKHGNRGISSGCGSADVLAALGVKLELTPEQVAECIDAVGIGFCFAPAFHPAMKYAAGPRKELGLRTIFNMLGPLVNPAGAACQIIGVYDEHLTEPLAHVLGALGGQGALVVHGRAGHTGLDELATVGVNRVSELRDGAVRSYDLDARDFGLRTADLNELKGGTPAENAALLRGLLDGSVNSARRDVVVLNAGAALLAAGAARDLSEGMTYARESLLSGAALRKLNHLTTFTQSL